MTSPAAVLTFEANSEADTERLGRALADSLHAGAIIELNGPLGAGKTRLTRAIAERLAVESDEIISPTFTLVNEYSGSRPVYHFDLYRLKDGDEFDELGPDEYFVAGGVCLLEWGERMANRLPADRLRITIEPTGEASRTFHVEALGPTHATALEKAREALGL